MRCRIIAAAATTTDATQNAITVPRSPARLAEEIPTPDAAPTTWRMPAHLRRGPSERGRGTDTPDQAIEPRTCKWNKCGRFRPPRCCRTRSSRALPLSRYACSGNCVGTWCGMLRPSGTRRIELNKQEFCTGPAFRGRSFDEAVDQLLSRGRPNTHNTRAIWPRMKRSRLTFQKSYFIA